MKKLSLAVVDHHPNLPAELADALERVAREPRQRTCRRRNRLLWLFDWRQFATRYLRRWATRYPGLWVYRGGHHVAIHGTRAVTDDFGNEVTFDFCYARIIEA